MLEKMLKKHKKLFKKNATNYFNPVKLQLIGDYIEHLGGNSISCLLDVGVNATTSKSKYCKIKFYDGRDYFEIDYDTLVTNGESSLLKICYYVLSEIIDREYDLTVGIEGILFNTIDTNIGLDLDEAYIFLFARMINEFNFLFIENDELIDICNIVYKKYKNKNRTNLCYLNCMPNTAVIDNEMKFTNVNFEDFNLVLIYDNNVREDVSYVEQERKQDCVSAHMIVDSKFKYQYLCEFKLKELNECKSEVRDFEFKRIRHAITENSRVNEMFDALYEDDIAKVGTLLTDSHHSLVQDYEITTKTQEVICNLISRYNALGHKMISSKYNNSVFILVKDLQIESLKSKISKEYKEYSNSELNFLITNIYK